MAKQGVSVESMQITFVYYGYHIGDTSRSPWVSALCATSLHGLWTCGPKTPLYVPPSGEGLEPMYEGHCAVLGSIQPWLG